ncbi:MAG: hypothetical protein QNJ98_08590 [Planctomycetota bacterium]|nr:hypothetical protein [Planctomycetota bacterium]
MRSALRFLLALAVCSAICGCGEDDPAPAPMSEVPATPKAALAWVREAEGLDDPTELDRRLAQYPAKKPAFQAAPETQIVLTWRMQRAIGAGRIEDAYEAHGWLVTSFEGVGRTPRGRELEASVVHEGLRDAGHRAARERLEGPNPDREGAERALELASGKEGVGRDGAGEAWSWVNLKQIGRIPGRLMFHKGPRVVALVDDFALGEAILPQVLGRWQRDLGPMGLRVSVVPLLTGKIRVGLRRLRAQDEKAEVDSIRNRLIAYKVIVEQPAPADVRSHIGLEAGKCALFVADRKGQIVARMTGPTIDPRTLETVVQRVASR